MGKKKPTKLESLKAVNVFIRGVILLSVALIIGLYYGSNKGWFDISTKYILLPSYILVVVVLGFFGLAADAMINDEIKKLGAYGKYYYTVSAKNHPEIIEHIYSPIKRDDGWHVYDKVLNAESDDIFKTEEECDKAINDIIDHLDNKEDKNNA